jgi:hypothetical protein
MPPPRQKLSNVSALSTRKIKKIKNIGGQKLSTVSAQVQTPHESEKKKISTVSAQVHPPHTSHCVEYIFRICALVHEK